MSSMEEVTFYVYENRCSCVGVGMCGQVHVCVWVQPWAPAFLSSLLSYYLQFPGAALRLWRLAVKQISVYPDKCALSIVMTWEISIFFVLLLSGGSSRFFSEEGRQLARVSAGGIVKKAILLKLYCLPVPFCSKCSVPWLQVRVLPALLHVTVVIWWRLGVAGPYWFQAAVTKLFKRPRGA